MNHDVDSILGGGGAPNAFPRGTPVGTVVKGTITDLAYRQMTNIETGKPEFWDDGNPKMQWIVTVQTDIRDATIEDDDGQRRFFIPKSSNIHKSVIQAVKDVKAPNLEVGGTLAIKREGTEPAKVRGFNDKWLHKAHYEPPPMLSDEEMPF